MASPNLKAGYVFQPTGRELVDHYLIPRAGLGGDIFPGFIEEGVDVLSLRPRELPFSPNHRREHGEVWGFFFAAQPAGETCPAPGGCWVQYGPEKAYYGEGGGEAVAFRRRFAYRYTWKGGEVWSPTRWRMKEYRLNRTRPPSAARTWAPRRRTSSSWSTRSTGSRCSPGHRLSTAAPARRRAPSATSWTLNSMRYCGS